MTEFKQGAAPGGVRTAKGFTLLETLMASLLVAALSIAVLQSLAFALQARVRTRDRWRLAVKRWNRTVQVRFDPGGAGETLRPMPSARPIRVVLVEGEDPDRSSPWEVLRAEK